MSPRTWTNAYFYELRRLRTKLTMPNKQQTEVLVVQAEFFVHFYVIMEKKRNG